MDKENVAYVRVDNFSLIRKNNIMPFSRKCKLPISQRQILGFAFMCRILGKEKAWNIRETISEVGGEREDEKGQHRNLLWAKYIMCICRTVLKPLVFYN